MNLETFFEKFDQFADAPDAVVKMRELVLQLAVQGKLSSQLPGDAPVADLCEALSRAKAKRIKSGERRLQMVAAGDGNSTGRPISTPEHWAWVPLNQIGWLSGGMTPSKAKSTYWNGDVNWFSSKDIKTDELLDSELKITTEGVEATGLQVYPTGCLFMVARSGILKRTFPVSINRVEATANQDLKVLTPFVSGLERYLQIMLRGMTDFILSSLVKTGMTVQSLKYEEFEVQAFPLPPLAEQRRIVAKVDELMALGDRLEAQQQERDTRHTALARASLTRFAEVPTPANLNLIFHKSFDIAPADLRKSILTLAVKGKLVPQDPKDEPVSAALVASGVDLKRWKVNDDEQRHGVPESWMWLRFAGVGEQRLGKMLDGAKNKGELKPYLRNTNVQWMRFELGDVKEMRVEEREKSELRLTAGDLLICEGGEPGRCAIWNDQVPEMYFQKALHRVRPCEAILSEFLALHLQLDCQNGVLADYFTGATIKHLTGRSLDQYPIPLAPLAEQRRIVAKVDQLMALVGQLETRLANSRATAAKLLDAVVAELTAKA